MQSTHMFINWCSEVLVENANPSDLELIDVEDNGVKPSATLETKGDLLISTSFSHLKLR